MKKGHLRCGGGGGRGLGRLCGRAYELIADGCRELGHSCLQMAGVVTVKGGCCLGRSLLCRWWHGIAGCRGLAEDGTRMRAAAHCAYA